jgi:hypothetical protein
MISLIESHQGIFAGTRIATLGFAMATAGLALPEPTGLEVAREASLRDPPDPQAGDSQIATLGTSSARMIVTQVI